MKEGGSGDFCGGLLWDTFVGDLHHFVGDFCEEVLTACEEEVLTACKEDR